MASLRIILVEPREAGNVGAVARSMRNFAFDDLVFVGELPELMPVAGWWASGAEELVRSARRVETLAEALSDVHLAIATTSSRGRELEPDLSPREVGALVSAEPDEAIVALVFGREDRGLTTGETALCGRHATIPTDRSFPVMNLAQALTIFCYETRLALDGVERAGSEVDAAPHGLVERLHSIAKEMLFDAGFLNRENPDALYDEMRRLAARARLTEREATVLLGMLRQIDWRRQNR